MGIVSIISLLASNSAMIFVGPRVYYAMARDGMFFPAAARVHPDYRTPATAIVAQAIWTTLLIVTGSGSALTTYTGFSILLFNGVAVAALFVLRRREPNAAAAVFDLGLSRAAGAVRGGVRDHRRATRCGPTWSRRSQAAGRWGHRPRAC